MDDGNSINSQKVYDYMKANHLTRNEFCKQCGISINTFYAVLKQKNVRLTSIVKIARTMNVRIHELFR